MSTTEPSAPSSTSGKKAAPISDRELREAMNAVVDNKDALDDLHGLWRGQLLRFSVLAVLLALHQWRTPMQDCIMDVKAVNAAMADEFPIDWMEATILLVNETLYEILGVVHASLLSFFLTKDPPADFTNWHYATACALVPVQLVLYFFTKRVGCTGGHEVADLDLENRTKSFPLGVIFHAVVTAAYWFMKKGKEKARGDVKQVLDVQKKLREEKAKAKLKKQLDAAGEGSKGGTKEE